MNNTYYFIIKNTSRCMFIHAFSGCLNGALILFEMRIGIIKSKSLYIFIKIININYFIRL